MPQHETERVRAERLFKVRERQRADAPKATADYYAAQQALRDKTRELRQLRLARDASASRSFSVCPAQAEVVGLLRALSIRTDCDELPWQAVSIWPFMPIGFAA